MPVVCDFTEIIGDIPETITTSVKSFTFGTGGRSSGSTGDRRAFLLFNIRMLTNNNSALVPVILNGTNIGSINPYPNSNSSYWYTQMISIRGSELNNGNNQLLLDAVNDSFQIKNMVCFFHQSA